MNPLIAPTKVQRVVIACYCTLLVYCLVWIPWCVVLYGSARLPHPPVCQRVGYGWLWAGPSQHSHVGDIFDRLAETSVPAPPAGVTLDPVIVIENPDPNHVARPDMELIALRLLAATLIFAVAMLLAGLRNKVADAGDHTPK